MKDTRRSFLKKSALISASVLIPDFLKAFGSLANPQQFIGKRLVVIQLSGGNDGLNCVVPFRNDEYFYLRPGVHLLDVDGGSWVGLAQDLAGQPPDEVD